MRTFISVSIVSVLLVSQTAIAVDYTWSTALDGPWSDPLQIRWSPLGFPNGVSDNATINAAGADYVVTLDGAVSINNFSLDSPDATLGTNGHAFATSGVATTTRGLVALDGSTWNGNGTGTLTNSADLVDQDGFILEALSVRGPSSISNMASFDQDGLLVIGGSDSLGNAALNVSSDIHNTGRIFIFNDITGGVHDAGLTVGGTLTNDGILQFAFDGGGSRSFNGDLVNNGILAGRGVYVDTFTTFTKTDGLYTNNGAFDTSSPGSFVMGGNSQTFTQAGGTLDNQGSFLVEGATFNFNGGDITGNAPVLRGATLNFGGAGTGEIIMEADPGIITGNLSAGQTLTIRSAAVSTNVTAAVGFTNAGTINLDSMTSNESRLAVTAGTLVNTGQINIQDGAGGNRNLSAELDNSGTFNVNRSVNLGRSGANHVNSGSFNILSSNAGVPVSGSSFTNTVDGVIAGIGVLDVTSVAFTSHGTVSPGLSAGKLRIFGDYSQSVSGALAIELGGLSAGTEYDQLAITGQADLDGMLEVSVIDGFVPDFGDSFAVLLADGGVNGTFDTLSSVHLLLDATYNANNVTIEVTGFVLPGDFDLDGDVDLDDYDIVSGNMYTGGAEYADGDANGDGLVNFEDFVIHALHFGETNPEALGNLPAGESVPEPGVLVMFVGGAVAMGLRRRDVQPAC